MGMRIVRLQQNLTYRIHDKKKKKEKKTFPFEVTIPDFNLFGLHAKLIFIFLLELA